MVARPTVSPDDLAYEGVRMAPNLIACRRDRWRQQQGVVYTAMTTQAGDVVAQYYAAFDSHRDGWQDLVTDDVLFDGPVQHAQGKADFVTLTGQFLQAHRETHLLGRAEDGNRVASLFEFVIDAPDGQQLVCPVAEWATVVDGRISEFRVYYDPRDFLRAFGVAD